MVHRFRFLDTNIVVDVNSGAVHVFDDVAYDVLEFYKKHSIEEIKTSFIHKHSNNDIEEAFAEIAEIEKNGQLFSQDSYVDVLANREKENIVKALCLHISHDCNLRCKYCFASCGDFGGERLLMDEETGKKAIDFLLQASKKRKKLEVDFFGGEPLMNFDVVKRIVEYARSKEAEYQKQFRFTITTNAVLLSPENMDYINQNMQNVVLSVDGRKEMNDNMRFFLDGSGSYDGIIDNILEIVKRREHSNYYVRGTFTGENLDFSKDVLHLADLGFNEISVEPVVAGKGSGYEIKEEHLLFPFKECEELAKEYVKRKNEGKGFNFFHFMLDLSQGPCIAKRLGGCGSGHEYLAITPGGDIYPCHQFVGMDEFKIGNVFSDQMNNDICEDFAKSSVYTRVKCNTCWAKFYCSGGCAANAYQFSGSINSTYDIACELERKRVECALWIKTQGY